MAPVELGEDGLARLVAHLEADHAHAAGGKRLRREREERVGMRDAVPGAEAAPAEELESVVGGHGAPSSEPIDLDGLPQCAGHPLPSPTARAAGNEAREAAVVRIPPPAIVRQKDGSCRWRCPCLRHGCRTVRREEVAPLVDAERRRRLGGREHRGVDRPVLLRHLSERAVAEGRSRGLQACELRAVGGETRECGGCFVDVVDDDPESAGRDPFGERALVGYEHRHARAQCLGEDIGEGLRPGGQEDDEVDLRRRQPLEDVVPLIRAVQHESRAQTERAQPVAISEALHLAEDVPHDR